MPLHRTVFTTAITVALLAACAGQAPKAADPAALVAGADSLDNAFLEGVNKGDGEAVAALYWNDPGVVNVGVGGAPALGWDATHAASVQMAKDFPGAKLEFLSHKNVAHGDMVLGHGTWKMTVPPATPDAAPMVMEGRYTDAKMIINGKWVYVMDHASVSPPPPPVAPAPAMDSAKK
jgi:ketosteroid isomerase-like protein